MNLPPRPRVSLGVYVCLGLAAFGVTLLLMSFGRIQAFIYVGAGALLLAAAGFLYEAWKQPSKAKEPEKPDIFEEAFASFTDKVRFEHSFVVAPSGRGKTTLMQHYLRRDFERVAKGGCSVIIMDATGDLTRDITWLERFAGPDTPLIIVDPTDEKFPPALSLFDYGIDHVSDENKAKVRASADQLIKYLFGSLLKVEMTGLQAPALNMALEVLSERPNSNLNDLQALLEPGGWRAYEDVIDKLRPDVRLHFEEGTKFDEQRSTEVIRRIRALNAEKYLSNMCKSTKTKLDFYAAMNRPSVIFIKLDNETLGEDVEIFGRYFLARILLAATRRMDIPEAKRFPCFLYIDECQHILKKDEKISIFMDGVRKYRVGGTFLTQRIAEFEHRPLDAIIGTVTTIFATDLRDGTDARFARVMGTSAQFISEQPRHSFALRSEKYRKAISVPIPPAKLFDEPKMSEADYERLRKLMRDRYTTPLAALHARPAPEPEDDEEEEAATEDDAVEAESTPQADATPLVEAPAVTKRKRKRRKAKTANPPQPQQWAKE